MRAGFPRVRVIFLGMKCDGGSAAAAVSRPELRNDVLVGSGV